MDSKEKNSQRVQEWIVKNRAKHNKRMALYMREYKKINPNNHSERQRARLLEILGGKCVKCGYTDKRSLQFDHIKGDGYTERKSLPNSKMVNYYLKNQDKITLNIQILCANCNMIKKIENNECSTKGRPRKY